MLIRNLFIVIDCRDTESILKMSVVTLTMIYFFLILLRFFVSALCVVYKIPYKLTDSSRLQYVIMTTNNRHYLFSKWRAVVPRASPSHARYYNWWPYLKWIQWTLAGIRMQVINSYFPGYVQYCVLPNNFSIMPQKITTYNPIFIWFVVYFQPFWLDRADLCRKAKQIWGIVYAPLHRMDRIEKNFFASYLILLC